MDGLEAVEIKYSELERTKRIDSEFFNKDNIEVFKTLMNCNVKKITELVSVSDGNHMEISSKFQKDGIPYYRGQDVHHFFIDMADSICIDKKTYDLPYMKRSHLMRNDVLLSIVGTIGKVAIFTGTEKATCNCKLAILRAKDIYPGYLGAFLQSKYGSNQIRRFTRGAVQMGFLLEDMSEVQIPMFSEKFMESVQKLIMNAEKILKESKRTYSFAISELLSFLGLTNFNENGTNFSIKSISDSFERSGRLDSEYFNSKYDRLFASLKNFETRYLGDVVTIHKSIEPGSSYYGDNGIPFARVSELSKYGIDSPIIKIPKNTIENISSLYPKKDTILLTKDGTVGIAYKLDRDIECVTSSAILHLLIKDKKNVLPDYLALVLNSNVVQMQAERDAGGSIIKHWRMSQINETVIPIIDLKKQRILVDAVQKSFALRKESEHLIYKATRAIEIAIEFCEEEGFEFIKQDGGFS